MKKFLAFVSAAALTLTATSAQAAVAVSKHGPFTVLALSDAETCAMGADNGTAAIYVSYNATTDQFGLAGRNSAISFRDGGKYSINVTLDSQTYQWTGTGVATGSGRSSVAMEAGDSVNAFEGLVKADTVVLSLTTGEKIVTVNSDADFEAALVDTVKCSIALKQMAAESSAKHTA